MPSRDLGSWSWRLGSRRSEIFWISAVNDLKMASSGGLTEEQKRRIEENRRRALQKRAQKLQHAQNLSTTTSKPSNSFASTANKSQSTLSKPINSFSSTVNKFSSNHAHSSAMGFKSSSSSSVTSNFSRPTNDNSDGNVANKLWRPSCLSKPGTPQNSSGQSNSGSACSSTSNASSTAQGPQSSAQNQPNNQAQKPVAQFYKNSSTTGATTAPPAKAVQTLLWSKNKINSSGPKPNEQKNIKPNPAAKSGGLPNASGSPSLSGSCILISRSRFMVDVAFHAKLIEIFKSMGSRSYDANTKKWSFSLSDYDELMEAVKAVRNEVEVKPLPTSVSLAFRSQRQGRFTSQEVPEADLEWVDQKLVQCLMPFQRIGVNFAIHHGGRALIADEMGLGKTIQAICVACFYRQEWPMLVVSPSSMRFSWAEAFLKWVPSLEEHEINVVTSGKEDVGRGLINILSYDLMSRQSKPLQTKRFKVIIMDESHFLKNFKTARTKAAVPLLKFANRVILLSGTPALSRPSELFQQLNVVNPRLFPSFHDFAVRYCDAKQNHFGWDYSGSSNLSELQLLLEEKVMVRRLKKDVLSQLPAKTRQVVMMDPSIVKTGSRSLKCAAKDMENKSKSEQHGALLKYFSETGIAKIPALREYIADMAECGHKFLVFAHHQTVMDAISEALVKQKIKYVRIEGSTSSQLRNELVEKFQTNESYQVAVLSITACNAGITMTAASTVLFAELFWNPGILVQAEDRVHRIGQQDSVSVRYLIAKGTADDYIWPLVQKKLSTLSKAGLSGDDFRAADTTEFKDPKQKSILSYFEKSFIEDEDFSREDLDMLDAVEATAASEGSQQSGNVLQQQSASPSENKPATVGAAKPSTGPLFSSYTGKSSFSAPVSKKPRTN